MRAIVTGGQGFIGRNLCHTLSIEPWESWEVVSVDDLSSGHKDNVVPYVDYYVMDFTSDDFYKFAMKFKPDVIFHLGAIPRVSYSVEFPKKTSYANIIGTLNVLDVARDCGARVINSSSSSIYGGADKLPTPADYPSSPKSPYALQKWHAEEWCRMYANLYDVDAITLRYFNVFGPYSRFGGAYSTVLSAWLYHIYVDQDYSPFLEGDGSQTRDFCFVDNVVQANIRAATTDKDLKGMSFNVAQGESHSLVDCKNLIEEISGQSLDLEMRPSRIGDVDHTLADISNTKSMLGYNPEVDFKAQLTKMAEWYEHEYADSVLGELQQSH